jgi:4-aminobutyrate aminotransferase-like enzyme
MHLLHQSGQIADCSPWPDAPTLGPINTRDRPMNTNADLLSRRQAAVVRGVGHTTPVSASRARNAELWDVEGKRYVDFAGGIAVVNTGHCHPKVIAAVQEQMARFTHTCFQVVMYEPYIALAERLNALAPISGPLKSVFLTTGLKPPRMRSRLPGPLQAARA